MVISGILRKCVINVEADMNAINGDGNKPLIEVMNRNNVHEITVALIK